MMKKPLSRRRSRTIAAVLLFVAAIGAVYLASVSRTVVTTCEKKEDAVREYLSYLSGSTDMASAEKGMKMRQYSLVSEQFGADAWENVSYTFEEIDPVDGTLGYRIVETGQIISESEYNRILREYWNDIAEKEGVSYYDIFLSDDESAEKMAEKRTDIIAKYSEDIPVQLIAISDTQTYRVNLSFNGKSASAQGFKDFHFIIDNRSGEWKVLEGLTWTEPNPEFPDGD